MVTLLSPPINPPVYSLATLQANTGYGVAVVNGSGLEDALEADGFTALAQRIGANPKLTYSLTLAEAAYPLLNGSTTFAIIGAHWIGNGFSALCTHRDNRRHYINEPE